MDSSPELLAGPGDVCKNFSCFWQMYRCGHPHHKVFDSPLEHCLGQVVPLLIHGDEGRSQKKRQVHGAKHAKYLGLFTRSS